MGYSHISRRCRVPFCFGLFSLDVYSEDRENGEHKHFIDVYLLKYRMIDVCYRTGCGNYYAGNVTKNSFIPDWLNSVREWFKFRFVLGISERLYDFCVDHHIFSGRRTFYNGKRIDFDRGPGRMSIDISGLRKTTWTNDGMSASIITDAETYGKLSKDYIIES